MTRDFLLGACGGRGTCGRAEVPVVAGDRGTCTCSGRGTSGGGRGNAV